MHELNWGSLFRTALASATLGTLAAAQQAGSIRGVVYDQDFGLPLSGAQVRLVETNQQVATAERGNYVFGEVPPGRYTLVFSKEGYIRHVRADVLAIAGQLTEVDAALTGEFTEMDEYIVQDVLQIGGGTEAGLLNLRFETPAMLDSISAELMSRAGASDAASALRLVTGASVQDGKFAVIRGMPDRYVSSQMNGVRLPTADEDKRAVELDQFPAAVLESLQVSKTFTPDQQGDASGGAVDVRLKGIPDESILQFKAQVTYDTQATGRNDFLTYEGGGVDSWGHDDGGRDQQTGNLGESWDGAVGVSRGEAPTEYKFGIDAGGKHELDNGVDLGAFASVFYERDSQFYDDGKNDSLWVEEPGGPLTPETIQGTPTDGDFKTALFDVTQASESVQWGGLGTLGLATDEHMLGLTYLYTHIAEDVATLAEDTRGKEFFFPGYDPNDSTGTGNEPENIRAAPYIRTETLEYTERTTSTLQLNGTHVLSTLDSFDVGSALKFKAPELDWTLAKSFADLDQPDKRQFGSLWLAESFNPGAPPFIDPFTSPEIHLPYKPSANFNLGNLQRIWKTIEEDSDQAFANLRFPFEQWSEDEGYLQLGVFADHVDREFDQDTFSNFGDLDTGFEGPFDDFWSGHFPDEDHPITASLADVDYEGELDVSAWYAMTDVPLTSSLNVIGGARFESTEIGVVNIPEEDAVWFPPGSTAPVTLNPGDADVDFQQDDVLPSIGIVLEPVERVTLRASYGKTVARQTFKELTPIIQQEFLGGPVFIGNPDLDMSELENYDLRLDFVPYEGGLLSASWFNKDIEDAIEYVQTPFPFSYTTAKNYPDGELSGWEFEVRQGLGRLWEGADGLAVGANATFIDSVVTLPADEIAGFSDPTIDTPISERDMTNAPEHLFNFYVTYDIPDTGTQLALFYTIQGDTLVAGAGQAGGNFVPSVYAKEYGTLNASVSQRIGEHLTFLLQAKNITNPEIEEVYRSEFIEDDVTKSSYTRGAEVSLGLSYSP